jgi:hypothetical protein
MTKQKYFSNRIKLNKLLLLDKGKFSLKNDCGMKLKLMKLGKIWSDYKNVLYY